MTFGSGRITHIEGLSIIRQERWRSGIKRAYTTIPQCLIKKE